MPDPTAPKSRSGSDQRRKSRLVTIRYTEEEYAELDEAASRAGLTRPSFIRGQSLAKPKTRATRRAPVEKELLAKVLGQLGKIGGNLNQLVHAGNIDPRQRIEAGEVLKYIRWVVIPAVMEALGRKP